MKYGYKVILKDTELKHYGKSKKDGAPGVGTGNWRRDHHGASVSKGRNKETGAEKIARTLHNIKWKTKYHFNAARDKEKFENNPNEFKKKKLESALNDDKWDMDFLEATQNEDWTADENGKPSKRMVEEYKKYLDNPEKYVSQQDFDKGNFGPAMAKLSGKDFDGDKVPEVGSSKDDIEKLSGMDFDGDKLKNGDKVKIGKREFTVTEEKYGTYLQHEPKKGPFISIYLDGGKINTKKAEQEIEYCSSKEFLKKAREQAAAECEMFLRDYKPDKTYTYYMDPQQAASTLDVQIISIDRLGGANVSLWPREGVKDWLGGHSIDYETGIGVNGKRYFRSGGING